MHSRGSPTSWTKSELATSPLPSQGPTNGQDCYVTLAFSGVPNKRDKIRIGYLTAAFSGAHKWAELLRNPCILGVPDKGNKIRIAYLTTTFSGAHKWAELLPNPCILGGPQQRGQIQNWLPHHYLLGGPLVATIAT